MSSVIYARVPDPLKQALEARARERGLSLTATLVELVERALEANVDTHVEGLEGALAACASELARTQARLAEAEFTLAAASEREQLTARTVGALAERARHELASCPQCHKPLRGYDLLVSGHCPNCTRPLTALLLPRAQLGAPDKDEYLALLAALGGLVGLALAPSSNATH